MTTHWCIGEGTASWEAMAAIQVIQALRMKVDVVCEAPSVLRPLLACAGIPIGGALAPEFPFAAAYREVDRSEKPYAEVLADVSGYPLLDLSVPKFAETMKAQESIVLCPTSIRSELGIPSVVWRSVAKMLRTYGYPVILIGDDGERMDDAMFTEYENLSSNPIEEKLAALASAVLVVGIPNAWTWASTAWAKKLVYLYPDGMPSRRWFSFSHENFGRILFDRHQLAIPIVLAGVRKLIDSL